MLSQRSIIKPKFRFQRDVRLEIFAIVVGFIGGLAGIIFRFLIELVDESIFGPHGVINFLDLNFGKIPSIVLTIVTPAIGGLIVGYAIWKYFPLSKGHGIPNVLEAMHSHQPIKPKTPIGKFFLSIITIGSGLSAGSEGPIAQIGAGAGSYLGRYYKCNPAEINILIAAGAGAGIASVFNAPLGGSLFAIEVLLAAISLHSAVPIVIACIVAVVLNLFLLGDLASVFIIPVYEFESLLEIFLVIILGIIIGFIAILWQKVLYYSENYFDNNKIPLYANTAIGGMIVGIILVFFSVDIRGSSYPIIHKVLGAQLTELTSFLGLGLGFFLILLCFLKIIATAVSLGSGVSGGIFAPSLFMGATFGAGYAVILNSIFGLNLNVGLYAVLGLAALFAAAARAPITMVVITVEMSGELSLLPIMMLTVVVAFLVHLFFVEESIYTEKIQHKGISSTARGTDELMNFITLEEVMTNEVTAILEETLLTDLFDIFMCYKHLGYPVVDTEGNLKGMVTMFDLRRIRAQNLNMKDLKVKDIMTKEKDLITAPPSMTIREATDLLHRYVIGRLPIVLRSGDKMKLVGILTRSDIIQSIESFQGFMEPDRERIKGSYATNVENPMVDIIPASYHHLADKVVIVSRDLVSEAEGYIKDRKNHVKISKK